METFGYYFLHSTDDKFYVEPRSPDGNAIVNECVCVDRVTAHLSLTNVHNIPVHAKADIIYGIVGIVRLIAGPYLIVIRQREALGKLSGHEIYRISKTEMIAFSRTLLHLNDAQKSADKTFCGMIQSVLNTDGYYYSNTFDLTHTLQRLQNTSPDFRHLPMLERADARFVWNHFVLKDIAMHRELHHYCIPIIHGFVAIRQFEINGKRFQLALISRRSWYRAGVRFHMRGLDPQGNVANFIETEQILEFNNMLCSFVQTRGSIPMFWTQNPNLAWQPFPKIAATLDHVRAYRLHVESHLFNYGKLVIVNLVNKKGREKALGENLEQLVNSTGIPDVKILSFDFHREIKAMNWDRIRLIVDQLKPDLDAFRYFAARQDGYAHQFQTGVFRTNCMDCLDRTNVIQSLLAHKCLESQLRWLEILHPDEALTHHPSFETAFKNVWADHGDMCSVQYAGTGALKADFTRTGQRTFGGLRQDLVNALWRYYKNNFSDGYRQDAIDLFLGNFPVEDIEQAMNLFFVADRDWKFFVPFALLIAVAMFVLCLIFAAEGMFMLFWLALSVALLLVIWVLGEEFTNKPKLKRD